MSYAECEKEDEEEKRWGIERDMKQLIDEQNKDIQLISHLLERGANSDEINRAESLIEHRRKYQKHALCSMRRRWYLDRGLVFDTRTPDEL